jgi:hypothetical protein
MTWMQKGPAQATEREHLGLLLLFKPNRLNFAGGS